ncbi:FadR/GntR family transcriptional regulator [Aquabacterium sp.]|uniref:FadR/GntR family transcriptional regulator n=1 Tax=Aquabacterium sp. TaxID=1872578 RepID=UPI0040377F82
MDKLLDPILRQPLSDALYVQLKGKIIDGELKAGERLPSERVLSEESGVNRGAVREAVKRLQQAGLVAVRQGGKHEVLDYRQQGSLELLPSLLINSKGAVDPKVVRSVMGMRSALAPEIAAEAAQLGGPALADKLDQVLSVMQGGLHDLNALQVGAMHFWQTLAIASDNIAYQLAFNTMRQSYHKAWDKLTYVMAREFQDIDNLKAISDAVRRSDADAARSAARAHVALGRQALASLFAAI